LNIVVITNQTDKVQNLALLKTRLNFTWKTTITMLKFCSKIDVGSSYLM